MSTLASTRSLRRGGERGAVLAEFALVLPMLAMLVLGVVDLGRAYRLKTELANAAREGVMYAQYSPSRVDASAPACYDPENVAFVARNEGGPAASIGVLVSRASDKTAIVGCERVAVAPGTKIVVTTTAPFTVLTPLVSAVVGSQLTLRSSVEAVVQG